MIVSEYCAIIRLYLEVVPQHNSANSPLEVVPQQNSAWYNTLTHPWY